MSKRKGPGDPPSSGPGKEEDFLVPRTQPDPDNHHSREPTVRAFARRAAVAQNDGASSIDASSIEASSIVSVGAPSGLRGGDARAGPRLKQIMAHLLAASRELDANTSVEAKIAAVDVRLAIQLLEELLDPGWTTIADEPEPTTQR